MLKIGITGGIGSGKTTVCQLFENLGVPVYSADEQAKILVANDSGLQQNLMAEFGEETFREGKYNRTWMAQQVFRDPAKLGKLNQIIHPAVARDFALWASHNASHSYVLHEAAILFESGAYRHMDHSILVVAPEALRIERIIKRDNTDKASVLARMKNQWSTDKIRSMADWTIQNDEKTLLLPQILEIHKQLLKLTISHG